MRNLIPLFKVRMADNAPEMASEVLRSGYVGEGTKVIEFEDLLRKYFNTDLVLTTNSATSAEHLILHMLKKPGFLTDTSNTSWGILSESRWEGITLEDEVLATPLTCTASNWPILANGFNIKWVDINPMTLNMDLDDLARKISPRTKAIMLVHWGGYPCDMDAINNICNIAYKMYGFKPFVIQDCAHAMGSTYKGEMLVKYGDACTFSFQAIKHLTTVDGGALVLQHKELYDRGKLLRWYGIDRSSPRNDFRCEQDVKEYGFKFHMNNLNAVIGIANFSLLQDTITRHRNNAKFYDQNLCGVPGITLLERHPDHQSSFWIYTILVSNRDDFMRKMQECNIQVSRVHERNDKHTCVSEFRSQLPNLDRVIKSMVCIPVGWWIGQEEREYIIDMIKKGW